MCDSLWPHGLQHPSPPCPSPTPRVNLNSCPLSRWCHPTILSSVVPFSSCLQSLILAYEPAIPFLGIPRESHSLKRHMHQSVHCSTIYYNTMCCFVTKSCWNLCDSMDCSLPGFPVPHHLPEFDQVQVHWISDATQPSHPLSPSSPPAFNFSQHQGLFQWVTCSYQVTKVLELQL